MCNLNNHIFSKDSVTFASKNPLIFTSKWIFSFSWGTMYFLCLNSQHVILKAFSWIFYCTHSKKSVTWGFFIIYMEEFIQMWWDNILDRCIHTYMFPFWKYNEPWILECIHRKNSPEDIRFSDRDMCIFLWIIDLVDFISYRKLTSLRLIRNDYEWNVICTNYLIYKAAFF